MTEPLPTSLPKIWCDFNACGWSGEPGDGCYYVFDERALLELGPIESMRLFVFDDDGDGDVIGCEGRLERWNDRWRVRPDEDTWFKGPIGSVHLLFAT
jgi:hypothetical protein